AGLHATEPLPDAAVLRSVPPQPKSLGTAETIAVDPSRHHPRSGKAAGDAGVLYPDRDPRALVVPRARAADPVWIRAPKRASDEKRVSSAGTKSSGRGPGVQERLQPRVPGPI